jgi:hypothetical protein
VNLKDPYLELSTHGTTLASKHLLLPPIPLSNAQDLQLFHLLLPERLRVDNVDEAEAILHLLLLLLRRLSPSSLHPILDVWLIPSPPCSTSPPLHLAPLFRDLTRHVASAKSSETFDSTLPWMERARLPRWERNERWGVGECV